MNETLWVPLVAVLGPLLGSAVGVLLPSRKNLLPRLLAFAAGTMLTISFLELIPESMAYCPPAGCFAGLAVGVLGVLALHLLLPETRHDGRERHTALLMLAAIMLHNLPEGIAMASGSEDRTMLLIAIAIATHDIPEGICTAAPYLYATGRRGRAFFLSLSTCLPTLLGYALGRLLWREIPAPTMGMVTACIAGLMITISCEELIPAGPGEKARLSTMPALMAGVIMVLVLRQIIS